VTPDWTGRSRAGVGISDVTWGKIALQLDLQRNKNGPALICRAVLDSAIDPPRGRRSIDEVSDVSRNYVDTCSGVLNSEQSRLVVVRRSVWLPRTLTLLAGEGPFLAATSPHFSSLSIDTNHHRI